MKQIVHKTLLAIMLIVLLASACTTQATPTTVPPTNPPAPVKETEPTAAPVVVAKPTEAPKVEPTATTAPAEIKVEDIELWAGGRVSEAAPPPDDWVAYGIIKDKVKVNLKLVLLPSTQTDQDTRINAAAASNSLPDLFMVSRDVLYRLVQAGLVAKVDDLLPLMPVRTKGHYSNADRNKLATWDGAMYGLPDPGALPQTDSLVIRQDWLDKLKLQAPKTLDEFMTVAKAFTFNDPDGNGKADTYGFCAFIDDSGLIGAGFGHRFDPFFGAYGVAGVFNLSTGTSVSLNVRDPNFMEAIKYIQSLNTEKVIDPDWPTLKKDEFRARWKQGKCGMMVENFAALATQSNYKDFDTNFPDGSWSVLPAPTGPDGKNSIGTNVMTARIYAVSQKAIDAGKGPAIARLLEWMANDEGYYLLGFGVKGENSDLDANGYITTKDIPKEKAWTSKEMQPFTQLANMVYIFTDVEMHARYPSYKTSNGRTMDPLFYYNEFQKMPFTQATGMSVINPPSNAADFIRFYSEGLVQFVLGQKALDANSWAAYLAGLDNLGAKDLEASAKEDLLKTGFIK